LWTIKINNAKKYTYFAGDFDHHANVRVQCGAIAQWITSSAAIIATRCHHWASTGITLLQRPPWLTISLENTKHYQKLLLAS